jgi:hypothetical protein
MVKDQFFRETQKIYMAKKSIYNGSDNSVAKGQDQTCSNTNVKNQFSSYNGYPS